jgi:hypothetical protein
MTTSPRKGAAKKARAANLPAKDVTSKTSGSVRGGASVWEYIKKNRLQDKAKKTMINS